MKKQLIMIVILTFTMLSIASAQFTNKQFVGEWKVVSRAYPKDSVSFKEGSPLKMNLSWNFKIDSMNFDFGGMVTRYEHFTIEGSILKFSSSKYYIESITKDKLVVYQIGNKSINKNKYSYKDTFIRVDNSQK